MNVNIKKKTTAPVKRSANNQVSSWRKQIEEHRILSGSLFIAPVRISERKDAYLIFIYKPGLKATSLVTHITGNLITVSGDIEGISGTTDPDHDSHFFRCFSLPGNAKKNRVNITYNDGIVKVMVYKNTTAV